jgi:hypothetical protein
MAAYRTMKFISTLAKEVEVNFPEVAGPIFIINAPNFLGESRVCHSHSAVLSTLRN